MKRTKLICIIALMALSVGCVAPEGSIRVNSLKHLLATQGAGKSTDRENWSDFDEGWNASLENIAHTLDKWEGRKAENEDQ